MFPFWSGDDDNSNSNRMILGIIFGCIAGVILLGVICTLLYRCLVAQRSQPATAQTADVAYPPTTETYQAIPVQTYQPNSYYYNVNINSNSNNNNYDGSNAYYGNNQAGAAVLPSTQPGMITPLGVPVANPLAQGQGGYPQGSGPLAQQLQAGPPPQYEGGYGNSVYYSRSAGDDSAVMVLDGERAQPKDGTLVEV